jgi:hydrogenase maturation protein HypF
VLIRVAVRVEGVVQGVGFRPFVYALATRLGLSGFVGNDVDGVFAEIEGSDTAVSAFLRELERDAPPQARIERVTTSPLPTSGSASQLPTSAPSSSELPASGLPAGGLPAGGLPAGGLPASGRPAAFSIIASEAGGQRRTLVPPDTATCADCLRELTDPADRRFGYPFINCTNCGPRFTIVRDVPYDRPLTTMAGFSMCERCEAEYQDPADRRFHAQPVCCPACGPALTLIDSRGGGIPGQPITGQPIAGEPIAGEPIAGRPVTGRLGASGPIATAALLLRDGQVLAVKGLGGYHLAVDAAGEDAARTLRARKHREDKPFAVLVADLDSADELCEVTDAAAGLLTSAARPIVLLPKRRDCGVAAAVAPGNRQLGVMLPYTPLHHLLIRAVARPLVLTSGNVSNEPIAYRDEDALARLRGIADAFLTHDRPIHIRTDDSVVRVHNDRPALIRRSRGYVPSPITVHRPFPRPVLACGAELKNTFCLAKEQRAFVSQHIGDLENAETLRSFTEGIDHFKRLFDIEPEVVAHDLHPEYLSTKYALELDASGQRCELRGVQHHHAHIASCLADNDAEGPVIGVAFDGTGYGTDGTIWGGEFLVADLAGFERAGHLAPVPMPGGTAAIKEPWRMAAMYLDAAFDGTPPDRLAVIERNAERWPAVLAVAKKGINSPVTSSAGRLFDAVAALLGVRDTINYEGQAAVELEQLAAPDEAGWYQAGMPSDGTHRANETAPIQATPDQARRHSTGTSNDGTYRADRAELVRAAAGQADGYHAGVSSHRTFCLNGVDLVRAAADDLRAGIRREVVAARFHNGVAAAIEAGCVLARERSGLGTVALSGGVFQNLLLLRETERRLAAAGFTVLTHSRVPCNDGGISLGQAVVAAAHGGALPLV